MDVGYIGYNNHAASIINLSKKKFKKFKIYHPSKKLNSHFTNSIDALLDCDCIFILCPSKFHFKYLKYFNDKKYSGYIFCEKIPVVNEKELKNLSRFVNGKTYFNFNLRHSYLNKFLNFKKFGKLLYLNVVETKPYLNIKNLSRNWRINSRSTLVTNVLSHYIDLILYSFCKKIIINKISYLKINKKFKLIDNIALSLSTKKTIFNFFISYNSVLSRSIEFYFEKGKIEIKDENLKILFDNNKNIERFSKPKIKEISKIKNLFLESNKKSVEYFINLVNKKKLIPKDHLKISISSTKEILSISERLF